MVKPGLIDELFENLSRDWGLFQLKESSLEAVEFQKSLPATLTTYKQLEKSNSPELILAAEKLTLQQELATYANSAEMVSSINPDLKQLEEASGSLTLVQDKEAYAKAAHAFSAKRKQGGLPLDAFREFILSHTARLTNRLKGTASVSEKNILRQRKDNLRAANKQYQNMQREALGLK
ncbi:hypothetical protein [Desulfomicrobium baculatum]|uniref:Uncharacterized protein n=1 Tax=Desulfomicrobium baculatum (strain DSM 4028 / VKM B-1378 / X) TaxID=525897 RepID=C7LWN0_DESBD|nr:hypothetical protein [Desulfomicrobium baculatum]ACU89913.1 hypothetical protein Dbac_1822 [Desulfomicrobium baculatum DSM 4028]